MPGRRQRGFERCGAIPTRSIGLPQGRVRDLELGAAWSRVAGEAIARQTRHLRLARGRFEVVMADRGWAGTVRELVDELSKRLFDEPALRRARKLCLVVDDEPCFECVLTPEAVPEPTAPVRSARKPPARARPAGRPQRDERASGEFDRRLQAAAVRMLERRAQKP